MLDFRTVLYRVSCLLIFAFIFSNTNAQVYNYEDDEGPTPPDSVRGLYIGLNLGVYFANKNTAFMYDGHGYNRDGTVITDFTYTWLNQAIQGSITARNRTSLAMESVAGHSFNDTDWSFSETDMPQLMTYSGSFMYGGHVRYMFNSDFGVFVELNGTNPVTVGEFTIVDNTVGTTNQPGQTGVYRFGIRGEEQRLLVNLGMHRVMLRKAMEEKGKSNPTILPYFDAGINMTFVKFQENFIELGSEGNVNLMDFYNEQGQFILDANVLTGVGFGGFAAVGAQITLGRKFTIDIGYVASFETIKLGEVKKLGLQNQLVLKAIYM